MLQALRHSVVVVVVVAPVVAIPGSVIIVVVAVPARADGDLEARAPEVPALRLARGRGSHRHRADERDGAKNLGQVPRHGSSPAGWRFSGPCCRMQPDPLDSTRVAFHRFGNAGEPS